MRAAVSESGPSCGLSLGRMTAVWGSVTGRAVCQPHCWSRVSIVSTSVFAGTLPRCTGRCRAAAAARRGRAAFLDPSTVTEPAREVPGRMATTSAATGGILTAVNRQLLSRGRHREGWSGPLTLNSAQHRLPDGSGSIPWRSARAATMNRPRPPSSSVSGSPTCGALELASVTSISRRSSFSRAPAEMGPWPACRTALASNSAATNSAVSRSS